MRARVLLICLSLALVLSCLPACGAQPYSAVLYNKLNTDVTFTLYNAGEGKTAAALVAECEALLDRAEKIYSRTDPQAELACLNAAETESISLSPSLAALLSRSLALAEETGGLFDPTAGILSALYDITGTSPLPTEAEIEAARTFLSYRALSLEGGTLTRAPGTVLDFGAIAKGYLAEQLVTLLTEAGVSGGVLSLGGNIAVFGEKTDGSPFRIAIRSPEEGGGIAGVLSLQGTAYVSTSGAYERYRIGEDGRRYHHIFDPRTGRPSEGDLLSVTVVSQDGARADALSTALFVAGYEGAIALWEASGRDFEMLLIREGGEIYTTPALSFTPA